MYGIIVKNRSTGREADLIELEREKRSTRDPRKIAEIREAQTRIAKERHNGKMQSMREALIKAHRNGNTQEIKDIHDFIKGKQQYSNEY